MVEIRIKKIAENIYEIPKTGEMNVAGRIFANDNLIEQIKKEDVTLMQVSNVATLPGIVGVSLAMPDCHMGYGACIGSVSAFSTENGIISPGMVGFDINCVC